MVGVPQLADTGISIAKLIAFNTSGEVSEKRFYVKVESTLNVPDTTLQPLLPSVVAYPNPSSGQFVLTFFNIPSIADIEIEIFNIIGQKIWQGIYHSTPCLISLQEQQGKFPAGAYFVLAKIKGREGKIINLRQKILMLK